MKYLIVFVFILMISGVLASDYSIVFNQVGDKLVVKENNLSSFVSSDELDKTDLGYYFIKQIKADKNYSNFIVSLNLEVGVVAESGQIFPVGYISSSDGQTISLVWSYYNVSKGDDFAFFVSLEDKKNNVSYVWIYYVLIIILVVLGFVGVRYLMNKRKDMSKYLLDDEKRVIQLLKQADGKGMWQKNIQTSLGFSKAKLSRMIRNLESRGLIEKIPVGNTNKVRLK